MQKTSLNLAIITTAALLTACGSSSDDISPADKGNPTTVSIAPATSGGQAASTPTFPTPSVPTTPTTPATPNTPTPANPAIDAGNRVLASAPGTPNASERAAFNRSKQRTERTANNTNLRAGVTYIIKINGSNNEMVNLTRSLSRGNFTDIRDGFESRNGTYSESVGNNNVSTPVIVRSYQSFRSGVVATYETTSNEYVDLSFYGANTPASAIPKTGKATYTGTAFDKNDKGSLTYNVDFGAKTGQGYVDGLSQHGRITLNRGVVREGLLQTLETRNGGEVSGTATTAKGTGLNYVMHFFGNQAEEIAGYAANDRDGIALHGTRGEITQ